MEFSEEERHYLFFEARKAIASGFAGAKSRPENPPAGLMRKAGVFVTITENGQLRGCIGYPLPEAPLALAVADNAVNAAFHDPRFPPLSKSEFKNIRLEITVLTEPKAIEFKNPAELLSKVEVGRDGLIIRLGAYVGLFLPQVPVEQGWDKRTYLSELCLKAGLPQDAWLTRPVSVESFEGTVLREDDESEDSEKRR